MDDLTAHLQYFRRVIREHWSCDGHEVPECEAHCYCSSRKSDLEAFENLAELARIGAAINEMPEGTALHRVHSVSSRTPHKFARLKLGIVDGELECSSDDPLTALTR